MKTFLLLSAMMFAFMASVAQKSESDKDCWYNKDLQENKVPGVSSDRAYEELLQGKTPKPVIVAIIDGGTDFNHEDLKDVIWTNEDEIPGNGIDDDKNGYIDDIHGWNFLGNPDGRNVDNDNLEVTRVYRLLKPKYENADSAKMASDEEFQLYLKCKKEVETKYAASTKALANVTTLYQNLKVADSVLTIYFGTNKYSANQLKTIKDERMQPVVDFMSYWMKKDIDTTIVKGWINHYESQALYRYNVDFDSRTIVGDDWTQNNNPYYGNNDVKGPRAGHGTMVAGNVAAVRGNGIGPDGVTSNAQLMILLVVPDGDERDKDVANAILYAVNNGASIINMSFGKGYSPQKHFVDSALRVANEHDVLIIHAAGNDGENVDVEIHYPSNFDENGNIINDKFIVVGASTNSAGKKLPASFSNYGKKSVDIFSPGQDIYSCAPGNKYELASGTSMASPVATGVATIIRAYFPELTAKEVKEILLESAIKYDRKVLVPGGSKKKVSFSELSATGGVINAYNAVKMAQERVNAKH
jgi:subtilisin family serine protease